MSAFVPGSQASRDKSVSVEVGHAARMPALLRDPGLVLLGIAPPDHPWLADVLPGSVVRESRPRDRTAGLEHVRVRAMDRLQFLPGLGGSMPSLLRDAAALALGTGLPTVDLILLRTGSACPWRWDPDEVWPLLEPLLYNLPGAILVAPDLGGPNARGFSATDAAARTDDALPMVLCLARELGARWQTLLVDLPDPARAAAVLHGLDVGLCGWQGSEDVRAAHGWRSAAALVGAQLASVEGSGIIGRSSRLVGGRFVQPSRREALTVWQPEAPTLGVQHELLSLVQVKAGMAQVTQESSLRAPAGEWPLSALVTIKRIHWSIFSAADAFVFRLVQEAQAYALAAAIEMSTRKWVKAGVLEGPDGQGPQISAELVRSSEAPGLAADFVGRLRPWGSVVNVRVNVRPGAAPQFEVR